MAQYKVGIMDYRTAVRNCGKVIGNNTHLQVLGNGSIGVVYHNTPVVRINADNTYTLDSGGFRTRTTADRINNLSPAHVWQDKGTWYLGDRARTVKFTFEDGVTVDAFGFPIGKQPV